MKVLWRGLAVAVAALTLTVPSMAWDVDEDDAFTWAVQPEATGKKYWMVYACDFEEGDYSISIETDERWEETTSYASEVPTTLVINGQSTFSDGFQFVRRGDTVALELFEFFNFDDFQRVYKALYDATGEIQVSFFERSMTFAADDIADAWDAVDIACW